MDSFTEDDFDVLQEKYSIHTLIIHDWMPKPEVEPPLTADSWDEVFEPVDADVTPPGPVRNGIWPEW